MTRSAVRVSHLGVQRTHSRQRLTFSTRTLSVKDDHHKFRLQYYYGLPLVMRTSKLGSIKAKMKE